MKKQILPLVGTILVILLAAGGIGAMAAELLTGPIRTSPSIEAPTQPGTEAPTEPTAPSDTAAPSETTVPTLPVETTIASPADTIAPAPVTGLISAAQARAIAAGYVGGSPAFLEVSLDADDNPPVYEIELISGNYRYEIDIHAVTGSILELERETLASEDDSHDDEAEDD